MGKIKMPSARKLEQDFTLERAFDAFVKSSAARGLAEKTLQTYSSCSSSSLMYSMISSTRQSKILQNISIV